MRMIRSNRGTSIVEVLVVMVVLLIGIMTVVRLFPPGFTSVRHAESMTFAGRLAQYEIERWKNNTANLPEGVLPIETAAGLPRVVLNDQFLGPPINDDNAVSVRRIIGESTRIPFGGWSTGPTSGSLYVLAFSPIDSVEGSIAVRGGDLSRRILDADSTSGTPAWFDVRGSQYAIDYGQPGELPRFCFPYASTQRTYYINFSWWAHPGGGDPLMHTTTGLRTIVPPRTESWIDLNTILTENNVTLPDFIGIEPYSDTVSRGFTQVASTSDFSSDPYEYVLLDPVLGILSFNPLGFYQQEFGHALEARIDYDLLDPEIIREDKRVPNQEPYRINLTLNRIKQTGETQLPDGTLYQGIHPMTDPSDIRNIRVDVLAIDLETSMAINIDPSWINHRDGIITLPDTVTLVSGSGNITISPAGRNIRFFYKAEGDWSVQLHKAYSLYERKSFGTALDYKSYTIDDQDHRKLWFSACNGNNSMSVDYEYIDTDGRPRKVVGECHRAGDVLAPYNGVDSSFFILAHEPTRIFSVTGCSVKARVIWRESERWRYVDLDTILTRRPND